MTTCRDCGLAEDLEWGKTKAGKPILMQRRLVPHFALCPAKKGKNAPRRSRNGAKPKRDAFTDSVKLLRDMNYTATEAAAMLKDIPEAAPEDMVLAAITRMGAE